MRRLYFLLLLFSLTACALPRNYGPELEKSSDTFSEAMRWRDYVGAAYFLEPAARGTFLQQFQNDDLFIVDSRVVELQLAESADSATAEYLLEYYLLPSNRIKKWHWQQQWQLPEKNADSDRLWRIKNAPPAFP
ncbi:MAG TPA: hypothetical protein VIR78_13625 [Malonomonas sp.]